jgi:hypothetical protein
MNDDPGPREGIGRSVVWLMRLWISRLLLALSEALFMLSGLLTSLARRVLDPRP